jgi:hypothetical protein
MNDSGQFGVSKVGLIRNPHPIMSAIWDFFDLNLLPHTSQNPHCNLMGL